MHPKSTDSPSQLQKKMHSSWLKCFFIPSLCFQRIYQMLEKPKTSWRSSTRFSVRTRSSESSWRCSSAQPAPANRLRSVWWVDTEHKHTNTDSQWTSLPLSTQTLKCQQWQHVRLGKRKTHSFESCCYFVKIFSLYEIQQHKPVPWYKCKDMNVNVLFLCINGAFSVMFAEGDHQEVDIPQTAHEPVPWDGEVSAGAHCPRPHWLWGHQVREHLLEVQTISVCLDFITDQK